MVHPPAAGNALGLALATAVLLIAPAVGQTQPRRWRELTVPSSGVAVYHGDRARVVLATTWRSLEEDVSTCEWDGSAWLMRSARTQVSHRDQFGLAPSPSGSLLLFGGSAASQFLAETWVPNRELLRVTRSFC